MTSQGTKKCFAFLWSQTFLLQFSGRKAFKAFSRYIDYLALPTGEGHTGQFANYDIGQRDK